MKIDTPDKILHPVPEGSELEALRHPPAIVSATAPPNPSRGQVWLDTSASGITGKRTVTTITTSQTLDASDDVVLCDCTSGAITVTLPAAASSTGKQYDIKKIDAVANDVTIDGASAETIDDTTTKTISTQYDSVTIVCSGSEWWLI